MALMMLFQLTACGKKEYIEIMDQEDIWDTYDNYIKDELEILHTVCEEQDQCAFEIDYIEANVWLAPKLMAENFHINIVYSIIDKRNECQRYTATIRKTSFSDGVQLADVPISEFSVERSKSIVEHIKDETLEDEALEDAIYGIAHVGLSEIEVVEKIADDYYKLSYIIELYDEDENNYQVFTSYLYSDSEIEKYQSYRQARCLMDEDRLFCCFYPAL